MYGELMKSKGSAKAHPNIPYIGDWITTGVIQENLAYEERSTVASVFYTSRRLR